MYHVIGLKQTHGIKNVTLNKKVNKEAQSKYSTRKHTKHEEKVKLDKGAHQDVRINEKLDPARNETVTSLPALPPVRLMNKKLDQLSLVCTGSPRHDITTRLECVLHFVERNKGKYRVLLSNCTSQSTNNA